MWIAIVAVAAAVAGYAYHVFRSGHSAIDPAAGATVELMSARLPDLQSRARAIDEWRGQVVVVNFWATWCAPCREEIPIFVRLQQKYGSAGLQFVGIAIDQLDKVEPYAAEMGMNFPVLIGGIETIDLARKLGNRAGVLPFTIVLDRRGRVALSHVGVVREHQLEPLLASLL